MELQNLIIQILNEHKSLTYANLLAKVKLTKPNVDKDAVYNVLNKMRGTLIVRTLNPKTKDFLFTPITTKNEKHLERCDTVTSAQCEVIARQILLGTNIEEVAAQFTCKPLTIVRKVQQYCMMKDPELYAACIEMNRKTAPIDKLRENFGHYL
jgi:Fe2+ or Zn2+ uptake regulation protein